ncbi:MAG: acyltransferase [Proteobacteria bacterium]|nr:acyltransferase [Pseudomonadota bacterium]
MIASLHGLRGIAALLVVLFHWRDLVGDPGRGNIFSGGYAGVDLFFLISGFVMVVTTSRAQRASVAPFLVRRLFRVLPLATFATILAYNILPDGSFRLLWRSLFFLPTDPQAAGPSYGFPLNAPQWSLGYELVFYAIFAAALYLAPKYRTLVASAIIVTLVVGVQLIFTGGVSVKPHMPAASIFAFDGSGILAMLGNPITLEFIVGMAIGEMFLARRPPLSVEALQALVVVMVLLCVGALISDFPGGSGLLGWGALMALLLLALLWHEQAAGGQGLPWVLNSLGDWSYSIYVSHSLVAWSISNYFWDTHIFKATGGVSRLCLLLAVTLGVSYLLFTLIETPMLQLGKKLSDRIARKGVSNRSVAVPATS